MDDTEILTRKKYELVDMRTVIQDCAGESCDGHLRPAARGQAFCDECHRVYTQDDLMTIAVTTEREE
jgi:hypothetical protein